MVGKPSILFGVCIKLAHSPVKRVVIILERLTNPKIMESGDYIECLTNRYIPLSSQTFKIKIMEKERGITITNVDEVEAIAWQVFQDKLQLTFKSDLSLRDKRDITEKPEYQYYREEATKIYNKRFAKRLKAVNNKKYPVIDVPSTGKSRWIGGAYTLCFVYSKYKGNFILKGYMKEVEDYLKKNYSHYFCNFSLWSHGFNRDIWRFWKDGVHIFEPERHRRTRIIPNNTKYQVTEYSCSYETDEENKKRKERSLYFKRLPKKWIPEFNKF